MEPEGWGLVERVAEIAELTLVVLVKPIENAPKFATEEFVVLTAMVQLAEPVPVVAVRQALLTQIELAEWPELLV